MFIQVGKDAYIATAKIKQIMPYTGKQCQTVLGQSVRAKKAENSMGVE